jgi:hypothetical protein
MFSVGKTPADGKTNAPPTVVTTGAPTPVPAGAFSSLLVLWRGRSKEKRIVVEQAFHRWLPQLLPAQVEHSLPLSPIRRRKQMMTTTRRMKSSSCNTRFAGRLFQRPHQLIDRSVLASLDRYLGRWCSGQDVPVLSVLRRLLRQNVQTDDRCELVPEASGVARPKPE